MRPIEESRPQTSLSNTVIRNGLQNPSGLFRCDQRVLNQHKNHIGRKHYDNQLLTWLCGSSNTRNRSYRHRSSCDVYYYREMVLKYLKEITQWTDAPNTPNHTYIFDENNACVGYIPTGTKEETIFTQPIKNFSKTRRRFVELKKTI